MIRKWVLQPFAAGALLLVPACSNGGEQRPDAETESACDLALDAIVAKENELNERAEEISAEWESTYWSQRASERHPLDSVIQTELYDDAVFWANMVLEAPEGCVDVERQAAARGIIGW